VSDRPWPRHPNHEVFRHPGNQKWFALMMEVPGEKLGLPEREMLDILNLKCDPVLIASLRGTPGLLPAYHMNKENWITAVLDGSAPDAQIQTLLAMSYDMTAPGHGRTVKKRNENQAAAAHLR
jgi:predicted DNA-binding protein (MmcQ/YjbR family)